MVGSFRREGIMERLWPTFAGRRARIFGMRSRRHGRERRWCRGCSPDRWRCRNAWNARNGRSDRRARTVEPDRRSRRRLEWLRVHPRGELFQQRLRQRALRGARRARGCSSAPESASSTGASQQPERRVHAQTHGRGCVRARRSSLLELGPRRYRDHGRDRSFARRQGSGRFGGHRYCRYRRALGVSRWRRRKRDIRRCRRRFCGSSSDGGRRRRFR